MSCPVIAGQECRITSETAARPTAYVSNYVQRVVRYTRFAC